MGGARLGGGEIGGTLYIHIAAKVGASSAVLAAVWAAAISCFSFDGGTDLTLLYDLPDASPLLLFFFLCCFFC